MKMDNANKIQVGGDHYKRLKPEPWDVSAAWELCFFLGNVIKYVSRFREPGPKGGLTALKKARHYIDKKIELVEAAEAIDEALRESARQDRILDDSFAILRAEAERQRVSMSLGQQTHDGVVAVHGAYPWCRCPTCQDYRGRIGA